jgi:hypothetical protein
MTSGLRDNSRFQPGVCLRIGNCARQEIVIVPAYTLAVLKSMIFTAASATDPFGQKEDLFRTDRGSGTRLGGSRGRPGIRLAIRSGLIYAVPSQVLGGQPGAEAQEHRTGGDVQGAADPAAAPGQGVLGDHGEIRARDQDEHQGEHQEIGVF